MTEENTAVAEETKVEATPEEAPAEATETAVAEKPAEAKADAPADKPAEKKEDSKDNRRQRGGGRGPRRGRGRKKREPKEFEEAILQIDRVTRVTKGGRQLRFRVSVVIGDQKGRVGFGIGKSSEVMTGVQKAIAHAKRNLINVPVFEDTIPHAVTYKFKASKVLLFPAPEGKGVIAGGAVRKVLELAGVKNVLSKMHGSRNKLNSAYATIQALSSLQNRAPHKSKADMEAAAEASKAEAEKIQDAAEVKSEKKAAKAEKSASAKATADKKPAAKKKAPTKKKAD